MFTRIAAAAVAAAIADCSLSLSRPWTDQANQAIADANEREREREGGRVMIRSEARGPTQTVRESYAAANAHVVPAPASAPLLLLRQRVWRLSLSSAVFQLRSYLCSVSPPSASSSPSPRTGRRSDVPGCHSQPRGLTSLTPALTGLTPSLNAHKRTSNAR